MAKKIIIKDEQGTEMARLDSPCLEQIIKRGEPFSTDICGRRPKVG